jgi:hypothetical protein
MVTRTRRAEAWVVYRAVVKGSPAGVNAVCSQAEWEAMAKAASGTYTLLRDRIPDESTAERLARGTSGDTIPRGTPRPADGPAAVPAR